jgi:hypothetical protein
MYYKNKSMSAVYKIMAWRTFIELEIIGSRSECALKTTI